MTSSSLTDHDLKSLLILNRFFSGQIRRILALFREQVSPSEVLRRISEENLWGKGEVLKCKKAAFDPEREMENCEKQAVRLWTWFDSDYPALLREIPDPPLLLYMAGDYLPEDQAALAIVGSRHPSLYGREQARRFARELSQNGVTVISGFAQGIDHEAHAGALEIPYGRTVAVLGCGLDVLYPRQHEKLFAQIRERGCVVSEYALGTEPLAENFPRRNRIISGLSLGVLVVQAHARSGSLITAHEAVDQGRDVFAVPGPVDQLASQGVHHLLKEGAYLAESPADIMEILAPQLSLGMRLSKRDPAEAAPVPAFSQESTGPGPGDKNEEVLADLLKNRAMTYDDIARALPLASGNLAALILGMEIRKKIKKNPNGRFEFLRERKPLAAGA